MRGEEAKDEMGAADFAAPPAVTSSHMRVLHVIDSLSPAGGGPPEAVCQFGHIYRDLGVEIEIACLDEPGEPFLREVLCPVHALGQRLLGRYAFSPRLLRWLRENAVHFDVLIMNGIWTFPGLAMRAAARRSGVPYGVFIHGALDPWFNREYPLKHLKKLLYWPIQYRVLRDAQLVFFTSKTEKELAETSFRPNRWNGEVVPYGISDPEAMGSNPSRQIEAFHNHLPGLDGRRYLLFLGRIHEKKGCDLLLEAFAQLAPGAPETDVVIAGPDQTGMQPRLIKRAQELGIASRVHWPGMLRGDSKWGALRACDAFVLPSHQENFGISVVEALAVGRPVLISNQVNIWQEIQDDGVGLVEDDTLEGTTRMLRRWFELAAPEREAMAARTRRCFSERFTIRRTAEAILESFELSCLAGRLGA